MNTVSEGGGGGDWKGGRRGLEGEGEGRRYRRRKRIRGEGGGE